MGFSRLRAAIIETSVITISAAAPIRRMSFFFFDTFTAAIIRYQRFPHAKVATPRSFRHNSPKSNTAREEHAMKRFVTRTLFSLIILAAGYPVFPLFAQEAKPKTPEEKAAEEKKPKVTEEMTVTARKKEETIQQVPI